MSYKTYNIVVKEENNTEALKQDLRENFKFHNVREFYQPFKGIACQASETFKNYPFERFPDEFFKSQGEVEDYFSNHTQKHLIEFSAKYPDKDFAYIEVDCFGGKCGSSGYIIRNGERTFEQEEHYAGHMKVLQKLHPEYNTWFFYPFTRTFFQAKGGINGDVVNFSFSALGFAFFTDFSENKDFRLDITENELLLTHPEKFELYLMKVDDNRTKVLGLLFDTAEENINYLMSVFNDIFSMAESYINVDSFEDGRAYNFSTMDKAKGEELASISYRSNAFNTRPFIFDEPEAVSKPPKRGFFARLFGKR